QAAAGGLLVLRVHVPAGVAHRLDRLVEAHLVAAVAVDRQPGRVDRFHGGDRVPLDARDLPARISPIRRTPAWRRPANGRRSPRTTIGVAAGRRRVAPATESAARGRAWSSRPCRAGTHAGADRPGSPSRARPGPRSRPVPGW